MWSVRSTFVLNRIQQVALLTLAKVVMAWLIAHVDARVRRLHVCVMPENLVGLGMRVYVVRFHVARRLGHDN